MRHAQHKFRYINSLISTQPPSWSPDYSSYVHVTRVKMLKRIPRLGALLSLFYISCCFPHRSQRAYYSHFFFSENGRNVFVGGYQPLLPPFPRPTCRHSRDTSPFAEAETSSRESAAAGVSRSRFSFFLPPARRSPCIRAEIRLRISPH